MILNILIISISSRQINKIDNYKKLDELKIIQQDCQINQNYSNHIDVYTTLCLILCNFYSIKNYNSQGGAIYISISQSFVSSNIFKDCFFYDCQSQKGGALYIITTTFCNSEFTNCTFQNNIVYYNSPSSTSATGGALFIEQINTSFFLCIFKNNTSCSIIEDSSSESFGGCIYITSSNCSIKECKITNNTAYCFSNSTGKSIGGFIYCDSTSINIYSSQIKNNSALCITKKERKSTYSYGGCLYLYNPNACFIESCEFIKNLVLTKSPNEICTCKSFGGCIYSQSYEITINSSFFNDNKAYSESSYSQCSGGGIYGIGIYNFLIMNNCSINNNNVRSSGKQYKNFGGFISLQSYNAIFNNNNYNNNSVNIIEGIYGYGGTIFFQSTEWETCILNKCNFTNNFIYYIAKDSTTPVLKGAIFYLQIGNLTLNDCKFRNNTFCGRGSSSSFGECLCCDNFGDQEVLLNKCDFCNESASKSSIIYLSYSNLTINECKFNNITISSESPHNLISISNSQIKKIILFKCEFLNNHIQNGRTNGYILNAYNTNIFFDNCLVCYNKFDVSSIDGGLFVLNYRIGYDPKAFFNNSQFINNYFYLKSTYKSEGVLFKAMGNDLLIDKCNFSDNLVFATNTKYTINAMFHIYDLKLTFFNTSILNCKAVEKVGLIGIFYFSKSNATFENCLFYENGEFKGNTFYFLNNNQYLSLSFDSCIFKYEFNDNQIGSIIYLMNSINSTFYDTFINNDIYQIGNSTIFVFDGELKNSIPKKYFINNNCIEPHNSSLFVNNSFGIYNQNVDEYVKFDDAFNRLCNQELKSLEFTQSFCFSNSNLFSESKYFSKSNYFTKTNEFTETSDFSETNNFSGSQYFTETNDFLISKLYDKTYKDFSTNEDFDKSKYLSITTELIISNKITVEETLISHFSSSKNLIIESSKYSISNELIFGPDSLPSNTKSRMSKQIIIGIVVGCIVLLILISLIIIFVIYKNKKKSIIEINHEKSIEKAETNSKKANSVTFNQENDDDISDLDFWL